MTKKIGVPEKWDKLAANYRYLVPTDARYRAQATESEVRKVVVQS